MMHFQKPQLLKPFLKVPLLVIDFDVLKWKMVKVHEKERVFN